MTLMRHATVHGQRIEEYLLHGKIVCYANNLVISVTYDTAVAIATMDQPVPKFSVIKSL